MLQIIASILATIATIIALTGDAFIKINEKYKIQLRGYISILLIFVSSILSIIHLTESNNENKELQLQIKTIDENSNQIITDLTNQNNKLNNDIEKLHSQMDDLKEQNTTLQNRVILTKESIEDGSYYLRSDNKTDYVNLTIDVYHEFTIMFRETEINGIELPTHHITMMSNFPLLDDDFGTIQWELLYFNFKNHKWLLRNSINKFLNKIGGDKDDIEEMKLSSFFKISYQDQYGKSYQWYKNFVTKPMDINDNFSHFKINPNYFEEIENKYLELKNEHPGLLLRRCEYRNYDEGFFSFMMAKVAVETDSLIQERMRYSMSDSAIETKNKSKISRRKMYEIATEVIGREPIFHDQSEKLDMQGLCWLF